MPTEARGFTVIDNYEKMGLHASNTTELVLEDVEVPEENLLGVRGEGFKQFLMTLDGEELELGQWPLESLKRLMKSTVICAGKKAVWESYFIVSSDSV